MKLGQLMSNASLTRSEPHDLSIVRWGCSCNSGQGGRILGGVINFKLGGISNGGSLSCTIVTRA
jgi:hypothetical protein